MKYNERKLQVLYVLHKQGPMTIKELADTTEMRRKYATWVLCRYAKWGLVRRVHDKYAHPQAYELAKTGKKRLVWLLKQRE